MGASQVCAEEQRVNRLALGSAQFGMPYGIANTCGQVRLEDVKAIVDVARAAGMDTLDTAMGYGQSQASLGKVGVCGWKVVTKLPMPPRGHADIGQWATRLLADTLTQLHMESVYGLLLHHPGYLLSSEGESLYLALRGMKDHGLARKIGVSVYDPQELDDLGRHFEFDLVQLPLNVFDRRFVRSGWLEKLNHAGVEIHGRSVFLQGVLLQKNWQRSSLFAGFSGLWNDWDQWLASTGIHPLTACLSFALSHPELDKIVVGVDAPRHLAEILSHAKENHQSFPVDIFCDDLNLIDPRRWMQ